MAKDTPGIRQTVWDPVVIRIRNTLLPGIATGSHQGENE
jgi:hypothetical protein